MPIWASSNSCNFCQSRVPTNRFVASLPLSVFFFVLMSQLAASLGTPSFHITHSIYRRRGSLGFSFWFSMGFPRIFYLKNSKMIYLDQNLACKLVLQHFFFFLSFLMTFWISMYLSKINSFEKQTMTRSRMCNKYLTWKRRVLTQKSHTINKEIIVWISYVGPKRNFTNINISLVTDFNMKFWKTVQNRSRIKSLIKKQLI